MFHSEKINWKFKLKIVTQKNKLDNPKNNNIIINQFLETMFNIKYLVINVGQILIYFKLVAKKAAIYNLQLPPTFI